MKVQIGDIYKLQQSNQIIRIIGKDDFEILYDYYWTHNDSWAFSSNLNKKAFFYRMSVNSFYENAIKIDFKELSSDELNVFRPDLTIRIARIKDVSWNSTIFNSLDTLNNYIEENTEIDFNKTIGIDKIWLYPVSPKGRFNNGELIISKMNNLSIKEVLLNASKVRNNLYSGESDGIGIYRLGINKKNPSYYIGGYIDMAKIMTD